MPLQRYSSPLAHIFLLLSVLTTAGAFMPPLAQQQQRSTIAFSSSTLLMAGFGGASPKGKGANKKQKKDTIKKLKPKQQWDRYTNDLSASDRVRVAVRVVESTFPSAAASITDDNEDEWFQVGAVKSKDNAFTEAAVICQRAIMVQHARRMFPLKILANDVLEWGYTTMQGEVFDECWVAVPSRAESPLPDDVDKLIGFLGLADPTGFYAFNKKTELTVESKLAADFESISAQRRN
jgi:hypothetical protein